MGGEEQIARTKGELIESLPDDGLAVLNAAVPLVAAMAVAHRGPGAHLRARAATCRRDDVVGRRPSCEPSFRLRSPWGEAEVRLGVRGVHNVDNALAAAAVGLFLGLSIEQVGGRARVVGPVAVAHGPAHVAPRARGCSTTPTTPRRRRWPRRCGRCASLDARPPHRGARGDGRAGGPWPGRAPPASRELAAELGVRLVAVDTDLYGVDAGRRRRRRPGRARASSARATRCWSRASRVVGPGAGRRGAAGLSGGSRSGAATRRRAPRARGRAGRRTTASTAATSAPKSSTAVIPTVSMIGPAIRPPRGTRPAQAIIHRPMTRPRTSSGTRICSVVDSAVTITK